MLSSYIVAPFCFEVGGVLSPISIRDQMIRSSLVVDRAWQRGIIGPARPLLIVGAGAAGATGAIRAAQLGVRTVLIEKSLAPFSRQAGCHTRFIDPTQYDWPVDHWNQGCFPWKITPPMSPMPLPWTAAPANRLAIVWRNTLNKARVRFARILSVYYDTYLLCPPTPHGTLVEPTFSRFVPVKQFGAVLSTVGFGTEICTLGRFSGFRFWDADQLQHPTLGLNAGSKLRVLISGGGDGSLQDFIRILTTRSPGEIYEGLPIDERTRTETERRLHSAEDQAQRAHIWATENHDHEIYERLDKQYQTQVQRLRFEKSLWSDIVEYLDKIVRRSQRTEMVFHCTHFSRCYGLNRFVSLLLAAYLGNRAKVKVLYPNTVVHSIVGESPHSCRGDAVDCYGKEHAVVFRSASCPGISRISTIKPDSTYDVIVLRHGVRPPYTIFQSTLLPVNPPRHVIPYYSPW